MLAALAALAIAVVGVFAGGAAASASPSYSAHDLATSFRCVSANPLPAAPVKVRVDVYKNVTYPSDGLPGPAMTLVGWAPGSHPFLEYTTHATVSWKNLRTGRTGSVSAPFRGQRVGWQLNIRPGQGPIALTVRQKIGVVAGVPMVNPQYSTCHRQVTV